MAGEGDRQHPPVRGGALQGGRECLGSDRSKGKDAAASVGSSTAVGATSSAAGMPSKTIVVLNQQDPAGSWERSGYVIALVVVVLIYIATLLVLSLLKKGIKGFFSKGYWCNDKEKMKANAAKKILIRCLLRKEMNNLVHIMARNLQHDAFM